MGGGVEGSATIRFFLFIYFHRSSAENPFLGGYVQCLRVNDVVEFFFIFLLLRLSWRYQSTDNEIIGRCHRLPTQN